MIDRNRMTERISLSLVRLELRRGLRPLLILLLGVGVAGLAARYILSNINGGIGATHQMMFEVADATGVVPGRAEVRFYGIEAGLVTNVQLKHGDAVLTVTVADKFGPVYRNAEAEERPNTALQDMYLDITNRGTPRAGVAGPGYVIPISQTQSPTNLADVLNLFQPDVRTQMNALLDQFGNGLADRGADLRQAFIDLAPFLDIAGNISQQLATRAALTRQLVHNAGTLTALLASRSTQLRELVTSASSSLGALATEGGRPLSDTIQELPGVLGTLSPTLTDFDGVLPSLNRAITALGPVAARLPVGLRNLRKVANSLTPAVDRLRAPVRSLLPLVNALEPFSADLTGSLRQISPQLVDVAAVTQAASTCTTQLNAFFDWDASMSKLADQYSTTARGNAQFGFYSEPNSTPANYTYGHQCAGGTPLGAQPTPKYPGPAPPP